MKKHLLTVAMLLMSLSLTISSCSKDDDNKPADKNQTENTNTNGDKTPSNEDKTPSTEDKTPSGEDKTLDDKPPVVEKVTITLADGSTIQVDKDSKYKVDDAIFYGDGPVGRYFVNGEDVSGQEITVSQDITISMKLFEEVELSDGNYQEYQLLTVEQLSNEKFYQDEVFVRIDDVTDENVSEIKKYLTKTTNLILVGHGLTEIPEKAFMNCQTLKSISIPYSNVTTIAASAFKGCTNLESIELPSTVTKIGESAFSYCSKLKSISLPKVTEVGSQAFEMCLDLQSISLTKVTTINNDTFSGCISLTSVHLPVVEVIGKNAFLRCTSLRNIAFSDSLEEIKDSAFGECYNLTITIENRKGAVTVSSRALEDAIKCQIMYLQM